MYFMDGKKNNTHTTRNLINYIKVIEYIECIKSCIAAIEMFARVGTNKKMPKKYT